MENLTKIVTGMEKGPEAIQGNFDTLNGAIGQFVNMGPQTNSGLTWVNGFSDQDDGFFKYQTLTINGQKFLMLSGQIRFTQTYKAWSSTQMVKFPDGVGINNAHILSGRLGITRNNSNHVQYSVNSDGLYIMPFVSDLAYSPDTDCWLPTIDIIATI